MVTMMLVMTTRMLVMQMKRVVLAVMQIQMIGESSASHHPWLKGVASDPYSWLWLPRFAPSAFALWPANHLLWAQRMKMMMLMMLMMMTMPTRHADAEIVLEWEMMKLKQQCLMIRMQQRMLMVDEPTILMRWKRS
jgi:hypothetical protein